MRHARTLWTPAEELALVRLRVLDGLSAVRCAVLLGKSLDTTSTRLAGLGMSARMDFAARYRAAHRFGILPRQQECDAEAEAARNDDAEQQLGQRHKTGVAAPAFTLPAVFVPHSSRSVAGSEDGGTR